jgi:hypothetical protein
MQSPEPPAIDLGKMRWLMFKRGGSFISMLLLMGARFLARHYFH